jgi:hypothetical protein
MNYVNLSYDRIINDIVEYIEDNKIKLKKQTLKKKNNKTLRIKKY